MIAPSQDGVDGMEHVRCAICGTADAAVVATRGSLEKGGPTLAMRNVMCRRCGLVYMDPRPTAEEYAEQYRRFEKHRYGIDSQEGADAFVAERGARFDKADLIRFVASHVAVPPGSIRALDVGCAHGLFSEQLKRTLGCAVQGVEPSERLAAAARKRAEMDVFVGTLDAFLKAHPDAGGFHLIVLSHVFEHFPDPHAALEGLRRLLAPEGVVYVEVPDVSHFKKTMDRFFDLFHPYSYSPATLSRLLERNGWKAIGRADTKKYRLQAIIAPERHPMPATRWTEGGDPRALMAALRAKRRWDALRRVAAPIARLVPRRPVA